MPFKINISDNRGKTYRLELESEDLIGKKLKEKISGSLIMPELHDYELEIAGASDNAGFPHISENEGIMLKKVLLNYGKAMNRRSKKEGKKKRSKNRPKGLRLRKTIRGNTISQDTIQINLKIIKQGSKPIAEIFPEQNKPKEEAPKGETKTESAKKTE